MKMAVDCKELLNEKVHNEDRHFGNFGVLRDNQTGKIIGAAPIFDNGISLFNYATKSDLQDLSAYAKMRSTPYGVSFENICKEVMGPKQRAELRRVIGFKFNRHPSLNLSEESLSAIEKVIDERVRELLSLSRTNNQDKQSKGRDER